MWLTILPRVGDNIEGFGDVNDVFVLYLEDVSYQQKEVRVNWPGVEVELRHRILSLGDGGCSAALARLSLTVIRSSLRLLIDWSGDIARVAIGAMSDDILL